jgi:bacterioferritin
MQANWGLTELATHTRAESFEEMRHAEAITDRILLLEGLPNYQRLFSLQIGQTVREQFEGDLAIEVEVVDRLQPGLAMCRVTATPRAHVCSRPSSPMRSITSTTCRHSSN